jgi:hypothetical protein
VYKICLLKQGSLSIACPVHVLLHLTAELSNSALSECCLPFQTRQWVILFNGHRQFDNFDTIIQEYQKSLHLILPMWSAHKRMYHWINLCGATCSWHKTVHYYGLRIPQFDLVHCVCHVVYCH